MPRPRVYDGALHGQDYSTLKAQCLENAFLYDDDTFGPEYNEEWRRPRDICDDPCLFDEGSSRSDVVQGELGDCWFIASIATLAELPLYLNKVIPNKEEQSFSKDYAGIFLFRFWQYGDWVDVIIDDRLPVKKTHNAKYRLTLTHSVEKGEFWVALLEKAYAKLNGSYANLVGGDSSEAMTDLTGGVCEKIQFDEVEDKEGLFSKLQSYFQHHSLGTCSLRNNADGTSQGLIRSHAYTINKVSELSDGRRLVRVRNPYGTNEWTGSWSDNSEEWRTLKYEHITCNKSDDGEFWMDFNEFVKNFESLRICHTQLALVHEQLKNCTFKGFHGTWLTGGYCSDSNPQYFMNITEDNTTELVSILQKCRREKEKENVFMGFEIHQVPDEHETGTKLESEYRKYHQALVSPVLTNMRENSEVVSLDTGEYIIVAITYTQGETGVFYLRLAFDPLKNITVYDLTEI